MTLDGKQVKGEKEMAGLSFKELRKPKQESGEVLNARGVVSSKQTASIFYYDLLGTLTANLTLKYTKTQFEAERVFTVMK